MPSFPRRRLRSLFRTLLGTLMLASAQAAEPEPAARAQAIMQQGLEQITSISADEKGGVWALTDSGTLYHCRRSGEGKEARVECTGRQGPVTGGY